MSTAKLSIGDRMKDFYESRSKIKLLRRIYTLVRIDGQAFKTYTKNLKKPFDEGFMEDMEEATKHACSKIQGAKFAYVQSDEITILITDFEDINTDAWFDNDIQKLASLTASYVATKFNQLRIIRELSNNYQIDENGFVQSKNIIETIQKLKLADFDSRAFQLPTKTEVENYFIWRQQDIIRNSISSAARVHYSGKKLENINSDNKIEMLKEKGVDWDSVDRYYKNGRLIYKNTESAKKEWVTASIPKFTEDRNIISALIPLNS
jgi:tRNA(His) guanylyltransferase